MYDEENNLYQLIPVNNHDRNRVKREAFDSNKNTHILMKNNQENNEMTVQKDYGDNKKKHLFRFKLFYINY